MADTGQEPAVGTTPSSGRSQLRQFVRAAGARTVPWLEWISDNPIPFLLYASAIVFLFWLVFGAIFLIFVLTKSGAESGQFGDSFGTLNVLFSGFAFVALVTALFLQRQDIRDSLEEMRTSTEALTKQTLLQEQARAESTELLGRNFHSAEMHDARDDAYVGRREWFSSPDQRDAFVSNWLDREAAFSVLPELPHGESGGGKHDPVRGTTLLIDYYSALYHHLNGMGVPPVLKGELAEDSERLRKRVEKLYVELPRRYHWPYWRGYLLTLGWAVMQRYQRTIIDGSDQFPLPQWIDDLRQLDCRSKLARYDPRTHPVEKGAWKEPQFFDPDRFYGPEKRSGSDQATG